MKIRKVGAARALLACAAAGLALVPLSAPQEKGESPKAEAKKGPDPNTSVDLNVSVEGVTPVPENSKIELKGLDRCAETSASTDLKAVGHAVFRSIPAACRVSIRIFIPGMDTAIVPVEVAKYRAKPVRIQMKPSGPATVVETEEGK
jgi:hypothetical protein